MEKQRTHLRCALTHSAYRVHRLMAWFVAICLASWMPSPVLADPTETERYQIYELKYKDVSDAEPVVAEMLDGFKDSIDLVKDTKLNRLLLRGPEKAQRIAAKIVKQIDQLPTDEHSTTNESVVKSYPCQKSRIDAAVVRLRDRFGSTPGIRIAGDHASERLIIMAPQDVHQEIRGSMSQTADAADEMPRAARRTPRIDPAEINVSGMNEPSRRSAAPRNDRRSPKSTIPAHRPTSEVDEQFAELMHTQIDTVLPVLRKLLGPHCDAVGGSKSEFRITDARGGFLDLSVDRRRNGFLLSGDSVTVGQMVVVIQGLDDATTRGNEQTKILPLRGIDPQQIQEIQTAIRLEPRRTAGRRAKRDDRQNRAGVSNAAYTDEHDGLSTIRLIANQLPAANGAGNQPPMDDVDLDPQDLKNQLRRMGSDLEIEVMPDLDVIILRGNKNEVQEMTRLLKELEQLSIETEPKIEIYHLQNVRGESLAALIEKVNTDLTGGLRGKVSVTPLFKPNALLLIGWGETVASVKNLIEQLDQPIPPEAQFQVFRLKHADATASRTTVTEFFTNRTSALSGASPTAGTGLSPRVQVTADTRTNSLIVQAPPRDMQEATNLIQQLDVPGGAVVHQARIFKLRNSLAQDLATVLQAAIDGSRGPGGQANANRASMLEFLSIDTAGQQILKSGVMTDVKITAEPHTNSLLVSAGPDSMELIAALIRRLDETASEGAQIKVFKIVNGDATSLVQTLRSLVPPPSAPLGQPNLSNASDDSALIPARFSVDLRTNSIIVTGSTGDLRIIEALLLRLDQKDIEQRKNQVYRLKNAPANAVAKSVNDFLRSERSVQNAAPGQISPFQQIESEVVVVPESVSNSLIISATPRFFDEIEKLIIKLDAQPAQVMIQVLIAQIQLNNFNEFGIELGLQDSVLFDRSLLGNLITSTTPPSTLQATNTPGFNFNGKPLGNSGSEKALAGSNTVGGQALSNFGVGSVNSTLGYGGMVLSASSENVSVLIRALQQSNRLEVLSRPQIRTLDNQPAYIQIGQRVPRIETSSVNQAGAVNGIKLENVGLILGVTPRISPDGMVVMEVDAEKSEVDTVDPGIPVSVSASGTVITSPIFNITTAQTTVSANSGETIIIGGLITKNSNETNRRVPLLSDIPVLGNLFRYDFTTTQRSELLIILTPHVIRSAEESARIKRDETAKMHWCAGDVVEINGPGLIDEHSGNFMESAIPVIYPDSNPRGNLVPMEVPPEPIPEEPPSINPQSSKSKSGRRSSILPVGAIRKQK